MHARLKTIATIGSFIALALLVSLLATRGSALTAAERNTPAAPQITGIDTWLNSPPLTLPQLRGKVVLVDFWTYSCVNCVNTLPYVKGWYKQYGNQGLEVIGVHTPEYPFERDVGHVSAALKKFDIRYPVALDNQYATWNAFNNQYWPALYLFDKAGHVVYSHFGEGDYAQTEAKIRELLAQPG
ncbi:thioredoxin family protein [Paraburkholderia kirstenboschensis]|uniref:Thioredoxin family protein n=1 Tax=Paraburkholderia kirstenboschensis TaxID=1245436 RepID=A0ABZ0EJ36_9BURK|nr:thioredoxin family protein [Paraburkholderia kirstenboschensis]WOD16550.1 thioredoxin family protein [Paraburkholderia kirstenboschensis]